MPELAIESVPLEGAPRVVLSGELDLAGVPALERVLDEAVQASDGVLLLDMCELDFVDSSGLTALLRTRALLGREDRELALICPHGPVRRVFELAGIADLFPFYASRAEAAEALVPRQS
jgi:anti-sigma B factor antagonist